MEFFYNVDVANINIIIQKEEKSDFKFFNPKRSGDGFVCFLSGEGCVKINKEKKQEIKRGGFVLFKKDDEYEFCFDGPCSYVTSEMTLTNWEEFLPRVITLEEGEIEEIIKLNKIWLEADEFSLIESKVVLLRFFTQVAKRLKNEQSTPDAIKLAVAFLHKNYNRVFSLDDVASFCSVSASHLRKIFKEQTGKTVMEYREEIRINRAKDLLKSGVFKIKEVSEELGYCDVYHFSKNFKRYTSFTPAKFLSNK